MEKNVHCSFTILDRVCGMVIVFSHAFLERCDLACLSVFYRQNSSSRNLCDLWIWLLQSFAHYCLTTSHHCPVPAVRPLGSVAFTLLPPPSTTTSRRCANQSSPAASTDPSPSPSPSPPPPRWRCKPSPRRRGCPRPRRRLPRAVAVLVSFPVLGRRSAGLRHTPPPAFSSTRADRFWMRR